MRAVAEGTETLARFLEARTAQLGDLVADAKARRFAPPLPPSLPSPAAHEPGVTRGARRAQTARLSRPARSPRR